MTSMKLKLFKGVMMHCLLYFFNNFLNILLSICVCKDDYYYLTTKHDWVKALKSYSSMFTADHDDSTNCRHVVNHA